MSESIVTEETFVLPIANLEAETATEESHIYTTADAEMLARLLYGEARGVASETERAAVVWCVLNRVDSDEFPDTISGVVLQAYQFGGYSSTAPIDSALLALAEDVLARWETEKKTGEDAGRVLPKEYTYFSGDGSRNHFRDAYIGGTKWDWSLPTPYTS
ncbi:MAG: cell wall hydrolase [Lachnospiraceae bacterium]|nr:cell wall hydrolase [Lachnospiraceae bacterium]